MFLRISVGNMWTEVVDEVLCKAFEHSMYIIIYYNFVLNRWDPTMVEWPEGDFRIFVGDMGAEVVDEVLCKAFEHYPSFLRGKMIKDKRTSKTRGKFEYRNTVIQTVHCM